MTNKSARQRRPFYELIDICRRLQTSPSIRPSDRYRMAETARLAQALTEKAALERGRASGGP